MDVYPLGPFDDGPFLVKRMRHIDNRGSFEMAFEFERIRDLKPKFPQIQQLNLIEGIHGSIRGFHWSELGHNHWKVLTVVSGAVRDAFLDVRTSSFTFGSCGYIDLDPESKVSLVIPPGFAHGVQTLSPKSSTIYATNVTYKKNEEKSISPVRSGLDEIWIKPYILSKRDSIAEGFDGQTLIIKPIPSIERI